jgi:hypothetical protein
LSIIKKKAVKTQLDHAIEQLELDLQMTDGDSKEYAKKVKNLERLYVLKIKSDRQGISPDTIVIVLGNLLGILIVVGYERAHVIGSRAINMAGKLR